jgi:hypothetical protein
MKSNPNSSTNAFNACWTSDEELMEAERICTTVCLRKEFPNLKRLTADRS